MKASESFSLRTEWLANRMGINLSDLGSHMGIAKSNLHTCRTGKRRITQRTWLKLRALEEEFGISAPEGPEMILPEDLALRVREEAEHRFTTFEQYIVDAVVAQLLRHAQERGPQPKTKATA